MAPIAKRTPASAARELDLRGIACPLNWAKARVHLDTLERGAALELVLDDPRGARDIPRAAEALGYDVTDLGFDGTAWRLRIVV